MGKGVRPNISIVIPAFNEEKVIAQTLQQFLPYKKKHQLEVIVVDARSSDKTAEIARKYADKVIVEKERSNIAAGRNKGAFAAKGQIIIEMDADSRISDRQQFFSAVWETFQDPHVMCAIPRFRIHPEEELLKDRFFHEMINDAIKMANHFGSFLAKGECQIIRKSAFYSIGGYDERIIVGEDCDLAHRISRLGKVVILRKLTVTHSPRRFRKEGYVKLLLHTYLREGVSLLFTKQSHLNEWAAVR